MNLAIRAAAAAVAAGLLAVGCGASGPSPTSPSASPHGSAAVPAPATAPASAPSPFAYVPLFPFGNLAAVRAWQASYASVGHQPWHLNPGCTALAFMQGYRGNRHINKVAALTINGGDAQV